jgi:hypothetical protein
MSMHPAAVKALAVAIALELEKDRPGLAAVVTFADDTTATAIVRHEGRVDAQTFRVDWKVGAERLAAHHASLCIDAVNEVYRPSPAAP